MREEVLRMEHVTTEDYETTNLDNMSLHIFRGEIVGLLPVDGQGRKKLLETLQFNVPLYYGWVYLEDAQVNSYLRSDMSANRVYVISSRNKLVPDLTVCDNIFVLRRGFKQYVLDRKILYQETERVLGQADIRISPDTLADQLPDFERVAIELLKAVMMRAKLIVIDEIAAILSTGEILKLKELMQGYAKQGFSFLYVANHHEELVSVCDRLMIMKYGRILKSVRGDQISDEDVLQISGSEGYPELYLQLSQGIVEQENQGKVRAEDAALEFRGVCTDYLKDLSFSVRPGECMTLLDRSSPADGELLKMLGGKREDWKGTIVCGGKCLTSDRGVRLLDDSIAVIEEYAHKSMIFPHMTFMENLCIMADRKVRSSRMQKKIRKSVRLEYGGVFGRDLDAADMRAVSKESKYTLVYYRYYMLRPKVVFCIRPFSGADMYLRRHILTLIQGLKDRGIAVVIVTSGLADSCFVADRLLMMEKGRTVREFKREELKYLWKDLFQNQ